MSCEVLSEKTVTTRKTHRCFACGRLFHIGSKMTYQANITDNEFSSIYACETCTSLMIKKRDVLYDDFNDIYHEGCVSEALQDIDYNTPEEWLKNIS